jgi:hypothetical protein
VLGPSASAAAACVQQYGCSEMDSSQPAAAPSSKIKKLFTCLPREVAVLLWLGVTSALATWGFIQVGSSNSCISHQRRAAIMLNQSLTSMHVNAGLHLQLRRWLVSQPGTPQRQQLTHILCACPPLCMQQFRQRSDS